MRSPYLDTTEAKYSPTVCSSNGGWDGPRVCDWVRSHRRKWIFLLADVSDNCAFAVRHIVMPLKLSVVFGSANESPVFKRSASVESRT